MGKGVQEFRQKVEAMIRDSKQSTFMAKVVSVNETDNTCEVQIGNTTVEDVRLNSIALDGLKAFVLIPKLESMVLVSRIGGSNEMFVCLYAEIDKLFLEIEETSFEISKDGFLFNDGENGGLIKIEELTKNLDKLTTRVDAIYDGLSKLSPDPPQAGSASVTSGLLAIVSPAKEDFTKLENELVKH